MFLLKVLYDIVAKLEKHIVLTTTIEPISEVVEVMWDVGYVGIRVDWLDNLINQREDRVP